jgi:WD40 repeat protein
MQLTKLTLLLVLLLTLSLAASQAQDATRRHIEWHPSENILAVSVGNSIQLLDGDTLERVNELTTDGDVYTFAWSNEGDRIAFSTWTETYVWDDPIESTTVTLLGSPFPAATESQIVFPVSSIVWNPFDDVILGSMGGYLIFWDVDSLEVMSLVVFDWSEIYDIEWSITNKIGVANRDSIVYLVDPLAQEIEKMYAISGDDISAFTALDFEDDGTKLVFGWDDGFVFAWDWTFATDYISRGDAKNFGLGMAHRKTVSSVDWNPNDLTIATGSQDGTAKLWNAETGELLQTINVASEGTSVSVAWNFDGTKLAYIADGMDVPVVVAFSR